MRDVTGNTFGNDATLILGDLIHNTTNAGTEPSAAETALLQDISKTNPVDDKKRILESKGPLMYDSYRWILEHNEFQEWRDKQNNGIFWIKGDPGKGKTMLLCGIIEDFENNCKLQEKIAYFFCQGTDTRLNTATAIIRGLIYSVLRQNQGLLSSIQEQIKKEPKGYLEGTNVWVALGRIFTTIIQDPCMAEFTFIIDALDECQHQESRKALLNLIIDTSSHVKWLISSRNEKEIENALKSIDNRLTLELKSNAALVSGAVDTYIDRCAQRIDALEQDADLRNKTIKLLKKKANGTFLWVTLVVQQLQDAGRPHIERILEEMPEDLQSLYDEIMERSKKGWKYDTEACLVFLATVTTAERPLHLDELYLFISSQLIGTNVKYLPSDTEYLAKACGSFITIVDKTVYLIHQSVKDYLTQKGAISILPRGIEYQHSKMFETSLNVLDKTLRCDIYNIKSPGEHVDQVMPPTPNPLASKAYCCAFWIEHLAQCRQPQLFQDGGLLHSFLKEKYLNWLEAMVLLKLLPQAVIAIQKLRDLITNYYTTDGNSNQTFEPPHASKRGQIGHDHRLANTVMSEGKSEILVNNEGNETLELTKDVYRLVFSHKAIIETYPLQIYASALIFSPSESISRKLFEAEQCPKWIVSKPITSPNWSPCIHTIEDYENIVASVAISPDNTMLAAVAYDDQAKVWDLISGVCLHTFETESAMKVLFSPCSDQLALIGFEKSEIWNLITGTRHKTIEGYFLSASFCADGTHLALVNGSTIEIHDVTTSEDFHTHISYSNKGLLTLIFPSDCAQLNSGFLNGVAGPHSTEADNGTPVLLDQIFHARVVVFDEETENVEVLDLATGRCLQTMAEDALDEVTQIMLALSSDGMRLAIPCMDRIRVWDLATGNCLQTFRIPQARDFGNLVFCVFSADGLQLASTWEKEIKILDIATGTCVQKILGHTHYVRTLAYSPDGLRLASGSWDHTIKVWDLAAKSSAPTKAYSECEDRIDIITLSPNGRWIALCSRDKTVRIWDTVKRTFLRTMKMSNQIKGITFSPSSMLLAIAEGGFKYEQYRNLRTGAILQSVKGDTTSIHPASSSSDGFIKIWDLTSGTCLRTIENNRVVDWIEFSPSFTLLSNESAMIENNQDEDLWPEFSPNESAMTIWALLNCAHETLSDPTQWKPEEFNLHHSNQMEMPFTYLSQGRQLHYNDELPMLSLSKDSTWILRSEKPLLCLPPDCRPVPPGEYPVENGLVETYKNHIVIVDQYNRWFHFEFCFDDSDV